MVMEEPKNGMTQTKGQRSPFNYCIFTFCNIRLLKGGENPIAAVLVSVTHLCKVL